MPPEPLAIRRVIIGSAIAAAIGLLATAWGVFSPKVLAHYADSPDSVGITEWAEQATGDDMLRWLAGRWIQTDSPPYYRPLASYLFWAEYHVFGRDFQGHVVVSWLIHAAICVCLYLLALRLFPGPKRFAMATSLLAVALFNLRLTPTGPYWPVAPVAYAVVAWWPAQTDQMSLLPSLLALIALDRWLLREDPRGLAKAAGLWLVALLFKEMAIMLPAIAGLLVIYRGGWQSLALPWGAGESDEEAMHRGLAWKVGLGGICAAAGFMAFRAAVLPFAPGIEHHAVSYYLGKAPFLLISRPWTLMVSYDPWVSVAAVLCGGGVVAWVRAPRRPSAVWLALGLILASGLTAQVIGGNFALVTIPKQLGALGTLTLFALGLIALAHVRVAWPWLLLTMAIVVNVPLLWVWGPHYFYWPAAIWALFNAGLWHYAATHFSLGEGRDEVPVHLDHGDDVHRDQ